MATNNIIDLGTATFIAQQPGISFITGDGTLATIVFGSPLINQGSCYDNITGIFTAPNDGNFQFNTYLVMRGLSSDTYDSAEVLLGGNTITLVKGDIYSSSGYIILSGSRIMKLTKNDQVYVQLCVTGGAKGIFLDNFSTFSGSMIL